MKSLISFIVLCLINLSVLGQKATDNKVIEPIEKNLILSAGFSYQGQGHYYGEINFMFSKPDIDIYSKYDMGPKIGVEATLNHNHFVYAPKISVETVAVFTYRGSIISYIDNGKVDLRLLPEIGVSSFGVFSITYGYNIALLDFKSPETTNNRITLTFNLWRHKL